MDPKKLDEAVAFMRSHWHLITGDESTYKPRIADAIRPVFAAAAARVKGHPVSRSWGTSSFPQVRRVLAWPPGFPSLLA